MTLSAATQAAPPARGSGSAAWQQQRQQEEQLLHSALPECVHSHQQQQQQQQQHQQHQQQQPHSSQLPQELFVTGRLCLFGEHTDWAGEHASPQSGILPGRCLVVGTQEGLHATVWRLPQPVLRMTAVGCGGECFGCRELPLDPPELLRVARQGGFWSYVAGTAYRIVLHHSICGGLSIQNHTTTLPLGKGLSSSAAVCVLVARAFNRLFDLKLSTRGEMELAYLGEVTTPSKCGRMDQGGAAFGPVPISMVFDRDILEVEPVALAAPLHLVLVDLAATKCTTTILQELQRHYPVPRTEHGERLHRLLGSTNWRLTENALAAMAAGDVPLLGRLMVQAQAEFDAAAGACCPSQLGAPALHSLLAHTPLQPLVWGGKGVGSQGDGTCQFLCRGAEAQQQLCALVTRDFPQMHCHPLTVLPTLAAPQQQQGKQQEQQEQQGKEEHEQQRQQRQQQQRRQRAAPTPKAAAAAAGTGAIQLTADAR